MYFKTISLLSVLMLSSACMAVEESQPLSPAAVKRLAFIERYAKAKQEISQNKKQTETAQVSVSPEQKVGSVNRSTTVRNVWLAGTGIFTLTVLAAGGYFLYVDYFKKAS